MPTDFNTHGVDHQGTAAGHLFLRPGGLPTSSPNPVAQRQVKHFIQVKFVIDDQNAHHIVFQCSSDEGFNRYTASETADAVNSPGVTCDFTV